jgi:cell wall assembly regulator SMI1
LNIESRISTIIEKFFNKQVDYYIDHQFHPCTDKDIRNLEQVLKCKLPATFVEFLQWAGRSSERIFGDIHIEYSLIYRIQQAARSILRWDRKPLVLIPQDAIVLTITSQDVGFTFFRQGDGDNPPIYYYPTENDHVEEFANSYTDYLAKHLFFNAHTYKIEHLIDWNKAVDSIEAIRNLVRQFISILMRRFFIGCSHQELDELENDLQLILPKSYKTFLQHCGRKTTVLFDDFRWEYEHILAMQQWAKKTLQDQTLHLVLQSSAFIFAYSGFSFLFFDLSEGQDPPIYQFLMEAPEAGFVRVANSFSEFLEQETEAIKYTVSSVFPYKV